MHATISQLPPIPGATNATTGSVTKRVTQDANQPVLITFTIVVERDVHPTDEMLRERLTQLLMHGPHMVSQAYSLISACAEYDKVTLVETRETVKVTL